MNIRSIVFTAVTVAALSPVIATAAPEKASAKACARAFAASIATTGAPAPAFKLDYRGSSGSVLSDFYPSEYSFDLEARDATGTPFARAVCSVDSRGTVTTFAKEAVKARPALADEVR